MGSNQNADILNSREIALEEAYTFIVAFSDLLKFYSEGLHDITKKRWIWNHNNLALILALSPTNKLTLLTFLIAPQFLTYKIQDMDMHIWNLSLLYSAKSMSLSRVHWQCLPVTPMWEVEDTYLRWYNEVFFKGWWHLPIHSFSHSSNIFTHYPNKLTWSVLADYAILK